MNAVSALIPAGVNPAVLSGSFNQAYAASPSFRTSTNSRVLMDGKIIRE